MEIFVSRNTQEYVSANYYLSKLEKYGVDIEDDNYIYHSKVQEFRTEEAVTVNLVHISAMYLIEKVFVGQERLEKLYGPYSFSVERQLTEKELKSYVWQKKIAEVVSEKGGSMVSKDVYQYYNRKAALNKDGNQNSKSGLIERLKSLGFDLKCFPDDSDKIRLLYNLFFFEYDNNVKLLSFLGNPTLENADNSFGGGKTRNGILLRKLIMPIYPIIDKEYVYQVRSGLNAIMLHWQEQVEKIRLFVDTSANYSSIPDLDRIDSWLERYLGNIYFNKNGEYRDSVLETFFLKISQHEYLGNEKDLISIRKSRSGQRNIPNYRPEECIRMAYRLIPKDADEIESYVKKNIDKLSCFVYDRENVTDQEKKKIIENIDSLNAYIEMANTYTKMGQSKYIKEYLVVAALAEILNPCNEKISNTFYRYKTSDQKKYSAELKNKKKHINDSSVNDAFAKSQLAWIDKVNERFDICLGRSEESSRENNIENNLDRLIIKILSVNNFYDMMWIHNLFKSITDAILIPDRIIEEGWDELKKEVINNFSDFTIMGEPYQVCQFIGSCYNTDIWEQIVSQLVDLISVAMLTGESGTLEIPIELYDNYIGDSNCYQAVFEVKPSDRELYLRCFGYCFYEEEKSILRENGIDIFEE